MITLTIKNPDGSLYWTEYFNDMDACNAWLEEEKTRPYWKSDFTYNTVADPVPSAQDIQNQQAIATAQGYLASTDWMIIRQMDNGVACPDDVKQKRAQARQTLDSLKS